MFSLLYSVCNFNLQYTPAISNSGYRHFLCWCCSIFILNSHHLQLNNFWFPLHVFRVFNRGWHISHGLVAYLIEKLQHCTSYFTTDMRNICSKTKALDQPRFIHQKQKNLAWILSNLAAICVSCSVQIPWLILAPVRRKCNLRGPNFQHFLGEHTPWTPPPHPYLFFGSCSSRVQLSSKDLRSLWSMTKTMFTIFWREADQRDKLLPL